MPFPPERGTIRWRLHLASPPEAVYEAIATPSAPGSGDSRIIDR